MNHSTFGRFALSFLSLIGGTAYSESFVTRIRHLPPVANTQCDDFAFAEGQRLHNYVGAGISITDARCFMDASGPGELPYWNIAITYEATAALSIISTYDEFSVQGHPEFTKRDGCAAVVKDEVTRFTRITKLPAFASYCRVPSSRDGAWNAVVLGFGNAEIQPFTASVNLFGSIVGHSADSFIAMVKQGMTKIGVELGLASVTGKLAYSTLVMNYYSKEKVRFDNTLVATFATKEACSAEVATGVKALADAGVVNVGTFCQAVFSNEIELTTIRDDRSKLTLSESDKLYDTNELCLQDKAAVVEHYRKDLKRDIKAGFCSAPRYDGPGGNKKFHVVMVEKR